MLTKSKPKPLTLNLQAGKPFSAQSGGKMGYVDFVWFILSEEDKGNDVSLEYWFKCVDLDDDGFLRSNEMLVGMQCAKYCAPPPAAHSAGRQCQGGIQQLPSTTEIPAEGWRQRERLMEKVSRPPKLTVEHALSPTWLLCQLHAAVFHRFDRLRTGIVCPLE